MYQYSERIACEQHSHAPNISINLFDSIGKWKCECEAYEIVVANKNPNKIQPSFDSK